MFLSFIVPVYNTEKYLEECLQSLLSQNLSEDEYEIICVNDGSTDSSLDILRKYEQQYSNIVLIDKANGGVTTARNAGIDVARGDYIWLVDSDDFLQDNILDELKQVAREADYDRIVIDFYSFNNKLSDEELKLKEQRKLKINAHHYDSVVTTSLMKRQYIEEHHLRFNYPDVTNGEDTIFMYEFKLYSPKQIALGQPFYFYRRWEASATTGKSEKTLKKRQMSYLHNAKIMKEYYDQKCGNSTDTANVLMSFLWLELQALAQMPFREANIYLRELKKDGLYPFKRPAACTLVKSYQTTRTDFVGKVFEKIYLNMHTRPGFWAMRVWKLLEKMKSMLRG